MNTKHSSADGRTPNFSRNVDLEELLKDINSTLWRAEKKLIESPCSPQFHAILLMGPMRSGTTLFIQWLANIGLVAYPTNLLSRLYRAPIIGAKIQLLLTDPRYNFRDELGEFAQQVEYKSENGKTKGVLAPNEFWYFWRRFLADPARDVWTDDELRQSMDVRTMLAELGGIMDVFEKPFAAKGMLFNYNIPFLDSVLDKVLFIQIKRDPVANVASVLDARKRQLGSEEKWYSFKIPEYERLSGLDPVTQVAGQVYYINRAVTAGLEGVADERKLLVQYEDFCANPQQVYREIVARIKPEGMGLDYSGPDSFSSTRSDDFPNREKITKALASFSHA